MPRRLSTSISKITLPGSDDKKDEKKDEKKEEKKDDKKEEKGI